MNASVSSENPGPSGIAGKAPENVQALHVVICVTNWYDQRLLQSACEAYRIPYTTAAGKEDFKRKLAVENSVGFVHVSELNVIKQYRTEPDFPKSSIIFVHSDPKVGAQLVAECGLDSVVALPFPFNIIDVLAALKAIADGRH